MDAMDFLIKAIGTLATLKSLTSTGTSRGQFMSIIPSDFATDITTVGPLWIIVTLFEPLKTRS